MPELMRTNLRDARLGAPVRQSRPNGRGIHPPITSRKKERIHPIFPALQVFLKVNKSDLIQEEGTFPAALSGGQSADADGPDASRFIPVLLSLNGVSIQLLDLTGPQAGCHQEREQSAIPEVCNPRKQRINSFG
jgi:hypothetical protein